MSIYSVEVVVRKLNDKGIVIEETLMDETAEFSVGEVGHVLRVSAAIEAAMLVIDTLDTVPLDV